MEQLLRGNYICRVSHGGLVWAIDMHYGGVQQISESIINKCSHHMLAALLLDSLPRGIVSTQSPMVPSVIRK